MEGAAEDPECVSETGDAPSSFDLLEPPTSGGFLKLSKPCCYIFPGGKGDSALFAVNGFNILVDGGSEQKSCFWKLVRHLDRIDSVLLTHIGADNLPGINGLFQRKLAEREEEQSRGSGSSKNLISPELGVVFFNVPEKLRMPESTLTVKRSIKEAYLMLQHLNKLGITPEPLFRVVSNTIEPITLFHKLGVGKLDMYVLNPVKESKEMQFLMQKWSGNSKAKTGIIMSNGKEGEISVPYLTSVTALIVWIPHSPTEKIVRVLFPGNAPQNKIFEGLEKLKHLDFLRYPVATQKEMSSGAPPPVVKQTKMRSRTDSKESLKSSPKTSKKESGGKEDVSKSDLNTVNKVEKKEEKKVKSESAKATKQQKNNEAAPQAAKLEKKVSKETSVKKDKTPKMDEKKDKEKTEIKKEKHEVKKADKVKKEEKKEQKAKEDKKNDPNKLRKITRPDMKPLTPEVRKTLHRAKTQTKPKADKNKAAKAQTKEEMPVPKKAPEEEKPVPKKAPEEEKPVPKTAPEEAAATTLADRSIVSSPEDLTEDFEALRLEALSKMSGVPKNDATLCHLDYTDSKAPSTAFPSERTSSTDTNGGTLVQRGEDNRDTGAAAGQTVDQKYKEEKMETYDKYPSEEEVKDRSRKSDSSEEEGDVIEKADLEGAEDAEQLKHKADEARKEKPGRVWDSKPDELFSTPSTQVAAALASEQFSFIQDETIPGYSETEQTISDEEIHEEPEDRIPQLRYDVGSYDISVPDVPGTFDSMHGIKEMRSAASGMDDVKSSGFGQSQDPMLASCPTIVAAPLAEEEHISSATSITEYDRLSSFPTSVAEDQSVASVTAPQTEETGRSSLHLDTINSIPSHTEATHGKEYLHSAGTISPTSSLEEDKCFKSPPSEEYQPIVPEMEAGTTVKPVHEEEEEDEEDEEDQTPNVDIPLGKLQECYEHAASVMLLEKDMSPATTAPRFPPLSPPCAGPESGFVHEAEDRCASPDDSTMKLATPVYTAGFSPAHESSLHDDTLGADKQKSERSVTISDMSSIIGQFADGTTFEASEESEESDEEEDDDDDYYVKKDLKPAVKAKLMEKKEGLFLDDDFTCEPKSPHEDKVLPQESSYLEDKELKAQKCTYVPFSSEEKSKPQVMYTDDEDDDDDDEDEKDSSKPLSVEQSKAASQYDKTTDYVVFKDPEKSVNFNLVDFPERESKENDRDMRQDTPYVHGKTFSYSDIYDSKASSVDSDMYQQESTDKLKRDCMKSYMDPPSLTTSGRTEGSHFTSSCGRDVSASPWLDDRTTSAPPPCGRDVSASPWLDDRTTSAPPPCGREQKAIEALEYSRGSRFPSMADRPEASSTCLSSEKDLSLRAQTHGVAPTPYAPVGVFAADKPSATGYGEIDMRKLTAKDEEDYDDDVVEEDDDDDDYEDEEEEEEYAGESDIEKGAGEKSEKEVKGPVSDISGSSKPELTPMAGYSYHRQGMPGTTERSSPCLTGKPAGLPGSPGGEKEPFLFSDIAGQEAAEALEFGQQKTTPLDSSTTTAAPAYSSSSAYSYSSSTSGSLSTSRQLGEDPETPAAAEPLFEYSSFKEDEYLEVSEKQQPVTATSPQAPVSPLEEAGPPAFPSPTAAPHGSRELGCFYRPGWCGGSGPAGVEDRGASAGAFAQFSLASTEQESASAALYGITSSPRPDVAAKHYFEETDSSEEEEREEEGYVQERPRRSPGAPSPARTAAELSPATPSGGTAAGLAAGYKTAYEWEMPKAPLVPKTPTPAQQEGGLEPERPTRPLSLSSGFAPPLYAEEQRWAGVKHSDHGDHSDHDDDDDDSDQDQPTGASLAYAGRYSSGRGGGGELSPSFVNPQQLSSDEDEEERGCRSDQSQEGHDPSVRRRPQRPGGPGGLALATEDTPPTSASESLDSQSDGEPDEEPDDYLPTRGSRDPPPVPRTDLSPRPPRTDACMVDPEAPGGPRKEPRPKGLRKSSGKPKAGSPARRRKSPLPTRQTLSPGSATLRRKEADRSSRASRLSDGQAAKEEELSRSSYATGRPLANGGKSSASPQKAGSAPSAIYVDLAYIPNHCNAKNVDQDFFKRVRSAYYVVSGNDPAGGEPSRTVLDALLDGKAQWGSNLQVTLIPTHDAEVTRDWYQQTHQRQQELNVMVLASSSTVVMQDESFSACKIEF